MRLVLRRREPCLVRACSRSPVRCAVLAMPPIVRQRRRQVTGVRRRIGGVAGPTAPARRPSGGGRERAGGGHGQPRRRASRGWAASAGRLAVGGGERAGGGHEKAGGRREGPLSGPEVGEDG